MYFLIMKRTTKSTDMDVAVSEQGKQSLSTSSTTPSDLMPVSKPRKIVGKDKLLEPEIDIRRLKIKHVLGKNTNIIIFSSISKPSNWLRCSSSNSSS